jgi:hypothetical protein
MKIMKTGFVILIVISLSGCVATRKGPPTFEDTNIKNCPEVIKTLAKDLEQLGIDHAKIQAWKNQTLSMKVQPCKVCMRMSESVYILKDGRGVYKPALKKLIQAVQEFDPNTSPPTEKQTKEIGSSLMESKDKNNYVLAGEYINALEDLQAFLISQVRLPPDEIKNFILDNFFIPLMKQDEKTQG